MSGEQFLDDPFNPQTPPAQSSSLPLDEIIRKAINGAALELHTWLPCAVTRVRNNGFVDVQPLLKRVYQDGAKVNLPVIQNVMVGTPSGAGYWIKLPVAVGDRGIALFCERSLDIWAVGSDQPLTPLDPEDPRHHTLSDAVFIPGLRPANDIIEGNPDEMVLHNGDAEVTLQPEGKFLVKNTSTGVELLGVIDALISTLVAAQVVTGIGPQNFLPSTIADLQSEQSDLESIKGS